jgi:hypothetical protein
MGLTMTEKILARHAGRTAVERAKTSGWMWMCC